MSAVKPKPQMDQYCKAVDWRYCSGFYVPRTIREERVLVHNRVARYADQPHGLCGFRCWTQKLDETLVRCKCVWSGLPHYRTTGLGIAGIPPVVTGKRCPAWMLDEDAELRRKHKAVRDAAAARRKRGERSTRAVR